MLGEALWDELGGTGVDVLVCAAGATNTPNFRAGTPADKQRGTFPMEADDVAPNRWVFDHPFFLILNVAVGGNLGGPVAADIALPQQMVVDYVRLYREEAP